MEVPHKLKIKIKQFLGIVADLKVNLYFSTFKFFFISFFWSSLMPTEEEEEIAGKAKLSAAKLNEAFKVAAVSVLWDLMF